MAVPVVALTQLGAQVPILVAGHLREFSERYLGCFESLHLHWRLWRPWEVVSWF